MALLQIAKVLKSNGTDGGVLFGFRSIDPQDIDLKEPVFIEFDGLPVPFFILDFEARGTSKAIVHLNDVRDLKDAEEIVGRAVYADLEEEEDEDEGDFSALIGWILEGVGEITDFIDIPANPCIEVKTEKGNVIVPIHEDLITSVKRKKKVIALDLPDGILDL